MTATLAVIGGTGLYDIEDLENVKEEIVDTPFGQPSAPITVGNIGEVQLLFLARHGREHKLLPGEVNYRANIYALKKLGASWCLSVSAVGSLKEEFAPGQVVVPDQFIDRTKGRPNSFFGEGIVGHVAFADPFCPVLRKALYAAAETVSKQRETVAHFGGTYLCMEGPAFSTRAESKLYRSWDASIIGMTNLPEAKLAREAEISYATLALVTDYDCWRTESSDVDITEILATLKKNTELSKEVIKQVVAKVHALEQPAMVEEALKFAIITQPQNISTEVKEKLSPIIGKYIR